MISVIGHNCIGFVNQNPYDARTKTLLPLTLLTDKDRFEKECRDSTLYKKACDLYYYIIDISKAASYSRFSLLATELELNFSNRKLHKYNLLSKGELKYIIDFIDAYGGFKMCF